MVMEHQAGQPDTGLDAHSAALQCYEWFNCFSGTACICIHLHSEAFFRGGASSQA
jgi:hypothetical protein